MRERARARAAIWLAGPDHDHVVTSLRIGRVNEGEGVFFVQKAQGDEF